MTEQKAAERQLGDILVNTLEALFLDDFGQVQDNLAAIDLLVKHVINLREKSCAS